MRASIGRLEQEEPQISYTTRILSEPSWGSAKTNHASTLDSSAKSDTFTEKFRTPLVFRQHQPHCHEVSWTTTTSTPSLARKFHTPLTNLPSLTFKLMPTCRT